MKFETEDSARQYLDKRVPPEEKVKKADLTPLKEKLFDVPKKLSEGHYEFEGKNGLKITYDLIDVTERSFDTCYQIYRSYLGHGVDGDFHPIFEIRNLKIKTDNFSDTKENHKQNPYGSIFWIPNLKSSNSFELSYSLADFVDGRIFIIDDVGFFSKPLNFLTFFHESGHIESPSKDKKGNIKTRISHEGIKTEPLKMNAYELQRERDANAWMLHRTKKLFKDLRIPNDLVLNYIHDSQLESYHRLNRKMLKEDLSKFTIES